MSLYNDLTTVLTPYANKIKQNESDIGDIQDELSAINESLDNTKADLVDVEDSMSQTVTEDIYDSLTFTSGYMGKNGATGEASTLKYSNKILVNSGDVLSISGPYLAIFRFVTAFAGDNAVEESGTDNVKTYTVPDGITDVVVTLYTTAYNFKIEHTHGVLIDVVQIKNDVVQIKNDVDTLTPIKDVLDSMKSDVQEDLLWQYGYFTSTALTHWQQSSQMIVYFKCRPSTVYTIKKDVTTPAFAICYIKNEPEYGVQQPVYNYVAPLANTGTVEYTTGDDALYMLILCGQYADHASRLRLKSQLRVSDL